MDFNHPLSGKALTFKGKIIAKRPATEQEIQKLLNYTQGGCCGGHCEGDCHGECKDGDGCHGGCKCHDNK
jgi:FKBP-type peptidyl-prolyl cis-trans isomerase 2